MIKFLVTIEYAADGLAVHVKPSEEGKVILPEKLIGALIGEKITGVVTEILENLQKVGGGKIIAAKGESAVTMEKIEQKRRENYDRDNTN